MKTYRINNPARLWAIVFPLFSVGGCVDRSDNIGPGAETTGISTESPVGWLSASAAEVLAEYRRHYTELQPELVVATARTFETEDGLLCQVLCSSYVSQPDPAMAERLAGVTGGTRYTRQPHIRMTLSTLRRKPDGDRWTAVFILSTQHTPFDVVATYEVEVREDGDTFHIEIVGYGIADPVESLEPVAQRCPNQGQHARRWDDDTENEMIEFFQSAYDNLEDSDDECGNYIQAAIAMIQDGPNVRSGRKLEVRR